MKRKHERTSFTPFRTKEIGTRSLSIYSKERAFLFSRIILKIRYIGDKRTTETLRSGGRGHACTLPLEFEKLISYMLCVSYSGEVLSKNRVLGGGPESLLVYFYYVPVAGFSSQERSRLAKSTQ